MEFKERLSESMKKEGITATELANKSGVNKSLISRYLSGERSPKKENIEAMAKALHVDISYLLCIDDYTPNYPDYVTKLKDSGPIVIQQYHILTDENKKQLENYMNFLLSQQDKPSEVEDDQS